MDYILSLSYGKDSLACLGAIEKLGWPLTRIIHAEVWATDTIPADLPPMVDFKAEADKIIKNRWGIEVEHVTAGVTFNDVFYWRRGWSGRKCKKPGRLYGWPMVKGQWCLQQLKLPALKCIDLSAVQYIGIAADEPNRFHNLSDLKRSPLVSAGWDEARCRQWCEENGLLSPIYTQSTRGGCWFCHNQGIDQLRLLRKQYPEYWKLMLQWDADSPVSFRSDGRTLADYDQRFQLEDEHLAFPDRPWHWRMFEEELQYGLF